MENEDFYKGVPNTSKKQKVHSKPNATVSTQKASNVTKTDTKINEVERVVIPNSIKITQSIKEIDTKIQTLQLRQSAGIDVEKELELLTFKSQRLWQLNNLRNEFSNIYNNYINGIINKSEYEEMAAKIRKRDIELFQPYQQIVTLTTEEMAKEKANAIAKSKAEQKKQRKKEIGRRLLEQGTLYVPPSASNWIRQGADALELLK